MNETDYAATERARAIEWKATTDQLPDPARARAPWINQEGQGVGSYPHCLPASYAAHNLLPHIRASAIALFRELGIPWHCGIAGGPGNNLLSSQVQCVNALFAMTRDPGKVILAFGQMLDIADVVEVEPGRFLTFEYIGPTNYFGEADGTPRVRGSGCTSVDAAFKYRTSSGKVELALVEWKYTESYTRIRRPDPAKDAIRTLRYLADFQDANGPLRSDVIPFSDMLDEPFYQLMRQQLLAHRLEISKAEGAERVRVVHVLSMANNAYQDSLTRATHRGAGPTISLAWQHLLRTPDRFLHVDAELFLNPDITSAEYAERYGDCVGNGPSHIQCLASDPPR